MDISADSCIQVGYNCANTRVTGKRRERQENDNTLIITDKKHFEKNK